ncbi:hypothetical protein B566_EDAN012582 [Ephemera danica]|nr:hypothetical protein B566_EDAN012582 [Ephemera danica]
MSYRGGIPALLMLLAAALFLRHAAQAQVTFSRDWTAGKRSSAMSGGPECSANGRSVATLCHMLIGELRQLASCELRAQMSAVPRDDDSSAMDGAASNYPVRTGR